MPTKGLRPKETVRFCFRSQLKISANELQLRGVHIFSKPSMGNTETAPNVSFQSLTVTTSINGVEYCLRFPVPGNEWYQYLICVMLYFIVGGGLQGSFKTAGRVM